ncbi:hypothetical protein B0J12DRAFT_763842 [Macrophomina phaseolina]|uniref:Uncharacterized protein n=1 Tax=Macrophomina phaseolina TaxID=35725 RepID=A0ABQ8GQQ5_9PEZI|nr:hypothetical protein B0J12DRAFT_763842 [Macrophomina phaseolina]
MARHDSYSARSAMRELSLSPGRPSASKEGTLGDGRVIPLPNDDPGALEILLNIAHFHFKKVPSTLSFHSLLHLAVLTEKHGATKLVRPWVEGWLKRAEEWVNKPGYEELLYVAWAFGRADIFVDIASHLAKNASVNGDGQCAAPGGRVLDPMSEAVHFPPGILESILQRRLEMISSLVRRIYLRLDDYLKTNMGSVASRPCCRYTARAHSDDVANCNALCFGSLILELQKIGLGPERKKAADIDKSVCSLTDSIRNMKVRSLADNRKLYGAAMEDHSVCSSHDFLLDPQAYALANVSPLLNAHQSYTTLRPKCRSKRDPR